MQRIANGMLLATLLGASALTACSSEPPAVAPVASSTTVAATTTTAPTTTLPLAVVTTPPSEAPAATDPPDATAPDTTEPETTEPPETVAERALTDDCLQGTWLLSDQETADLHAALLPGFPLTVEGSHQLAFDGETVEYFINEVLHFQGPGFDLRVPYDTRSAGSYTIGGDPLAGDTITMDYVTVDGGFTVIDGTVRDSDGNPNPVLESLTGPDFEPLSIGGGPATCDGDILTIGVTSGLANAIASFTRLSP